MMDKKFGLTYLQFFRNSLLPVGTIAGCASTQFGAIWSSFFTGTNLGFAALLATATWKATFFTKSNFFIILTLQSAAASMLF